MDAAMRDEIEGAVRGLCDAGDLDGATTAALRGYGEEVYSFLIARLRSEDQAGDVFSQTCEDLLRSLETFEWRCSLRTWFYRLARSAATRYERSPMNQRRRRVALSQITEAADQVRSRTMVHLRSEVKDGFRKLREQLDADEQMLLVLRVDRNLGWNEIAEILAEDGDDSEDSLKRASARLRQRFQKLKERLRELAAAEGLLD
jgi:RNA polymerase sigma-70 factor, ECF subfamily